MDQESKSEVVSVRLTPSIVKQLQQLAQQEERTVSFLIYRIVRDALADK
jgi:predicted transcriptional regulator